MDYLHKDSNQETYYYRGEPQNIIERFVGGPANYYTQEGALAHELLGHGLDYTRGDYRNNQADAINRANSVRDLLGIPSRYR